MSLYDSSKLYLYFNGENGQTTIDDNSSSAHSITFVKNAVLSNTQTKIGNTSLYLPGDQSYIYANDSSDFTLGSDDFWFEGYFYIKSNARQALFCMGSSGSFEYMLEISGSNTLRWVVVTSTVQVNLTNSWAPTPNTWYHIAFGRYNNNHYMFIDGVQIGTTQYNAYSIPDYGGKFLLGIQADLSTIPFNGYIDYFIFLKGVCRYTSNFIPPTDANYLDSVVSKDLEFVYNVGELVHNDLEIIYDIHSRVAKDLPIYYSIRENVGKGFQFINRIGELVHNDFEFDYNIYEKVNKSLEFDYNIGLVVNKNLEIIYNLIAPIHKDFEIEYNIGSIVNKSFEFQYSLTSFVGRGLELPYNIRARVFRQFRTLNNIYGGINKNLEFQYDIYNSVYKNIEIQYLIWNTINKDVSFLYNIFNLVSQDFNFQYNIYNAVFKNLEFQYLIWNVINKDFNFLYNLSEEELEKVYRDLIFRYNIPRKDMKLNLYIPNKIYINIVQDN